ncbi:MAG: C25 family cysteine peptidase [Methanobacteriota archaeon]
MERLLRFKKVLCCCFFFLVVAVAPLSNINGVNTDITRINTRNDWGESFTLTFSFQTPNLTKKTQDQRYNQVTIPGLPNHGDLGKPVLPVKHVVLVLPFEKQMTHLEIAYPQQFIKQYDTLFIESGQLPTPDTGWIQGNHTQCVEPDKTVYSSEDPYPSQLSGNIRLQHCRGYTLVSVDLYPLQYLPGLRELHYYNEITVTVYTIESPSSSDWYRGCTLDKEYVSGLVDNPEILDTYPMRTQVNDTRYEYVIITSSAYQDVFERLLEWKSTRGLYTPYRNLSCKLVSVEDIVRNTTFWVNGFWGDGGDENHFNDTSCQIRNFIKMAYRNWSTTYVLLGGDAEEPVIPHRGMYVYTMNQSFYSDYDIPCDMYYACLDGSWDADEDGIFGETPWPYPGDPPEDFESGDNGEEADFYAEISIGRAPVDSVAEANHFVNKTIAYEYTVTHDDSYVQKALMIGPRSDSRTERGTSKDAVLGIIPHYTVTRVYTRDHTFNQTRIFTELNQGTHIVSYSGHANNHGCEGVTVQTAHQLTNTRYCLFYSGGCYSAAFDNRDFYGEYTTDALGEEFVVASGGAFAYIGNSRYGWYEPGTIEGKNDRFERSFFRTLMEFSAHHQPTNLGVALQQSKESEGVQDCYDRWTQYTLNLLGDPETQIQMNLTRPTAHFMTVIEQGKYLVFPPSYHQQVSLRGRACRGNTPESTFHHYIVEYGSGFQPTLWMNNGIVLPANGTEEIIDDVVAYWDTRNLSNGPYTLRLTVMSQEKQVSQDHLVVMIANQSTVYNILKKTYYWTIQDAVDEADTGDLLSIDGREYYESVYIDKPLTLIGNAAYHPVIDSCHIRDGICVDAEDVILRRLTIRNPGFMLFDIFAGINIYANNVTVLETSITDANYGLCLHDIQNCVISGNLFTHNRLGLILYSPFFQNSYNTIIGNTFLGTIAGYSTGVMFVGSSNNTLMENTFINNTKAIELAYWSQNNSITGNRITDNIMGGYLSASRYNVFVENIFLDNNQGVRLEDSTAFNLFYHNTFDNPENAYDLGNNQWNIEYPDGGNYWNTYPGCDRFSGPGQNWSGYDGIGDTPMNISGGTNQDQYPFMSWSGWDLNYPPFEPYNPVPYRGQSYVNVYSSLQWTGGDPDDDPVMYDVYFGKTNPPPLVQRRFSVAEFMPGVLFPGGHMEGMTKYFWMIVVYDGHGNHRDGPVWWFKTAYAYEER